MNYSNPRMKAIIEDWPIGGTNRGSAIFEIETHPSRGQRATRVTEKKDRTWGKPKLGTYADIVRIVDGSDGRTYLMSLSHHFNQINVMRGDMKHSHETLHLSEDPERYAAWMELLGSKTTV